MSFGSKHPTEEDVFTFTYASRLGTGETIVSAIWGCYATDGTDPDAGDMISGAATIQTPFVNQLIIGGVLNVQYVLHCLATTSTGRKLYKWDTLKVVVEPLGDS